LLWCRSPPFMLRRAAATAPLEGNALPAAAAATAAASPSLEARCTSLNSPRSSLPTHCPMYKQQAHVLLVHPPGLLPPCLLACEPCACVCAAVILTWPPQPCIQAAQPHLPCTFPMPQPLLLCPSAHSSGALLHVVLNLVAAVTNIGPPHAFLQPPSTSSPPLADAPR
jgi:hypothetical protein